MAREYTIKPDLADVPYGPHERNVLDLWQAKTERPAPLLFYVHGGGFRKGDKTVLKDATLRGCLDAGISVASINYRLSHDAIYPAAMEDSARALQFIRSKADQWNIDTTRVAGTGGSAGAGIVLWLGFRDDRARPDSTDPIEPQSTRFKCIFTVNGQCSYDVFFIKGLIGGLAWLHPAVLQFFGVTLDNYGSPEARKLYYEASAINFLRGDAPPVLAFYGDDPAGFDGPGQGIHNLRFGTYLKERMDFLGIECTVIPHEQQEGRHEIMMEFLRRHLGLV